VPGLRPLAFAAVVGAGLILPSPAQAQTFVAMGIDSDGYTRKAKAEFSRIAPGTLQVVLTNLGDAARVNSDVLTAIWWKGGAGSYTRTSADASAGSAVLDDPSGTPYGGPDTVGQHWAYNNLGWGMWTQGIGSVGYGGTDINGNPLGSFGAHDVFETGGTNPLLGGSAWGLVNGTAAGGVNGTQSPFIHNSATFVLSGVDDDDITAVRFQYGTSMTEPFLTTSDGDEPIVTPEPASAILLGAGLPALALLRRRRKKG